MPPKAILIIDNCAAHGSNIEPFESIDGQIITFFLPPNVTSIIQPMDQGPINVTKLKYRNMLLSKVVIEMEVFSGTITDLLKRHTIRDAIILLKTVWDQVSESTLKTAWNKLLRHDDDEYEEEDNIPLSAFNDYCSILGEARSLLSQINSNENFTDEDVNIWNNDVVVANDTEETLSDSEESAEEMPALQTQKISHTTALEYANGFLEWCNQNKEREAQLVPSLLVARSKVLEAIKEQPTKQTVLSDFFPKRSQ